MKSKMPQISDTEQHCVARALYDNQPDSRDELAFEKGDILIVLEQNPDNIEGWWLCSLRGKQGICPANRLRLMPGYFADITSQTSRMSSPHFNEHTDLYSAGKRSFQNHSHQVVTPKRFNDVFLYDIPPSRCSPTTPLPTISPGLSPRDQHPPNSDTYDVPPRAVPVPTNDSSNIRNCPRCSPAPSSCVSPISRDSGEAYDIPRSLHPSQLTPSSSASSLTADSLSSSNRSSVANVPDYDVPKPHVRAAHALSQTYDVPTAHLRELPLELGSALENLERLQTDTTSAIAKLQSFVGPRWRTKEKLENNLMEIRLSVTRLGTSLHDLAEFGEGTLGNATRASDKNLAGKLAPMVAAIRKSSFIIQDVLEKLNKHNWAIEILAKPDEELKSRKPDEIEQLVACSRTLTEDIRQIASFIQGNGLLLFKSTEPNQSQLNNNNNNGTEYGDDDYVSLESKENVNKIHADILNELPKKLKKSYSACVKNAEEVAFDSDFKPMDNDDKQLLVFYANQVIKHHTHLTLAIDAFLKTVEHNQPPKIFLAHGKFVVLSAHKLVLIGDTVHRNVSCRDIKDRALNCANALLDALSNSVTKTKQAAQQFPSVNAVQEMVDSIVEISHSAKDLKVCLVQAANPL